MSEPKAEYSASITWQPAVVALADLVPWEHNPKTISKSHAKRLLRTWERLGQFQTIAIGPGGEVYDGHQRLAVLKAAYGDAYRVQVLRSSRALAEAERQELVIAAHVGTTGQFDWGAISGWDAASLQDWGMDAETLKTWNSDANALKEFLRSQDPETVDAEPQIDRAEELRVKWGVESGQLWQLGDHRLICGDCTDRVVVERVMGVEKAVIVSDPPYGVNVDTSWLSALNVKRGKPACMSDAKIANDDGNLDLSFVFEYKKWLIFGFPYVARYAEYTGLLVWDKRGDGGENGLGNPVEVAASNAFNGYRLSRHVWAGFVRCEGEKREPHPTQKPVGIIIDAINLIGDSIILDPFLGSGTTLIACENLGRKCRAVEISPAYVAVALERWATATGKTPVLVTE